MDLKLELRSVTQYRALSGVGIESYKSTKYGLSSGVDSALALRKKGFESLTVHQINGTKSNSPIANKGMVGSP